MRRILLVLALSLVSAFASADFIRYYPPASSGSGTWDGGTITDPGEAPAACTSPGWSFGTDTNAGLCLLAVDQPALTPNGGAIWARMLTTGLFVGHATTYDDIGLAPVNAGAGKFAGTITLADLTANRTWTFPDSTGTACVSTDCMVSNGATTAGRILFKEDSDNGSNAVTLIGPASTADVDVTLPNAAGTLLVTPSTITGVTLGGFTASKPLVSDGSGNATAGSGFSGNTTTVVTTTGAQTSGNYVTIDANGNHIAAGAAAPTLAAVTAAGATSATLITLDNGSTTAGRIAFKEDSDNGTNTVTLSGAQSTADVTVTLPNVTGTLPIIIASGAVTWDNTSINSGACSAAQDGGTATGTATTDRIVWNPNGDPTGITGYAPSASGGLYIWAYPGTNTVSFKACNNTAGAIDPGSITLNWMVLR